MTDNYHVCQLASKALAEVHREHCNELRHAGDKDAAKTFKGDRWALLKNPMISPTPRPKRSPRSTRSAAKSRAPGR